MAIRHCVLSAKYIFNEELVTSLMKNEGYTRNEATRKDIAMNFRDIASRFAYEVYCITDLYSRSLEKVKTDDTKQISVFCIKDITDDRVLNLLGSKNI